jgi:hypothetical protein
MITHSLADPQQHEDIHYFNRGTLFSDTFQLIELHVDSRATVFFDLTKSLRFEFHSMVWNRAHFGLRTIRRRLRGLETHSLLLDYLNDLMSEIHGRVFLEERSATGIVNDFSCISGVQSCEDEALKVLIEVMETGSTDFPYSNRCNAFRSANESIWMHFFNAALAPWDGRGPTT